jgi:transposase InsO family protein
MDLHTKKIVGYSFSRAMTTDLIVKALKNAYDSQKPSGSIVFHSDHGSQYTSDDFAKKYKPIK